ncbi:MAG: hypothetical protein LBO03_10045 [Acidaminococcales bacterium]|nr:hypothetical protein [Acidaminococcales bacterium]
MGAASGRPDFRSQTGLWKLKCHQTLRVLQ